MPSQKSTTSKAHLPFSRARKGESSRSSQVSNCHSCKQQKSSNSSQPLKDLGSFSSPFRVEGQDHPRDGQSCSGHSQSLSSALSSQLFWKDLWVLLKPLILTPGAVTGWQSKVFWKGLACMGLHHSSLHLPPKFCHISSPHLEHLPWNVQMSTWKGIKHGINFPHLYCLKVQFIQSTSCRRPQQVESLHSPHKVPDDDGDTNMHGSTSACWVHCAQTWGHILGCVDKHWYWWLLAAQVWHEVLLKCRLQGLLPRSQKFWSDLSPSWMSRYLDNNLV